MMYANRFAVTGSAWSAPERWKDGVSVGSVTPIAVMSQNVKNYEG
jgi:hypothetical protein